MNRILAALPLALLALCGGAWAQSGIVVRVSIAPPALTDQTFNYVTQTATGALRTQAQDGAGHDVSASHPLPVGAPSAAYAVPGCTVGTGSGLCLAAGAALNHVTIQNVSASATVACAWGGAAALNAIGSLLLQPGQPSTWGASTGGVPPAQALNCIASAAGTPLYVEYN